MKVEDALVILGQLEQDMKSYEFGVDTGRRKINNSLALLAVQAVQRYLRGQVDEAQADFATLADEMSARRGFRAGREAAGSLRHKIGY